MEPDYKVYNHFKSKFEKEVGKFGNTRMKTEIARLHDANEKRTKECNFKSRDNSQLSGKFKWWGNAELVGYLVSSKSCSSSCRENLMLASLGKEKSKSCPFWR